MVKKNETINFNSVSYFGERIITYMFENNYCEIAWTLFYIQYLNRLVVKGDSAIVLIPELEFEIPSMTQKGCITTVESIISQAIADLEKDQAVRKVCNSLCCLVLHILTLSQFRSDKHSMSLCIYLYYQGPKYVRIYKASFDHKINQTLLLSILQWAHEWINYAPGLLNEITN